MERLYNFIPVPLQNILISLKGFLIDYKRYSNTYDTIEEFVFERQYFDRENLEKFRRNRLRNFFEIASKNEYWDKIFSEKRIKVCEHVSNLPLLKKSHVQKNLAKIQNHDEHQKVIIKNTSGTTGKGLRFPASFKAEHERWATWWRYRSWHNIYKTDWCGYFGGKTIVPINNKKAPFWRINVPGKQVMFSIYHLNDRTIDHYVNKINDSKITWLHGYPSALSLLSNLILEKNLMITKQLKAITVGAENLFGHQRNIIEEVFQTDVRQHYCQAEGVANISECEYGNLHVDEDYSLVEFIKDESINGSQDLYRIIGTNWSNPYFPLFRYDTGDLVELPDQQMKCKCNRIGRIVKKIYGRDEDYVTLPDGRKIGRLDHIFKGNTNVKSAQIYQPNVSKVILRIVKGKEYSNSDERAIMKVASGKLGNEMDIIIEYVDSISKTKSGKFKFVISDIK